MKIISKYKDFYDFLVQDYNADINYVREPVKVYKNYDNLFEESGKDFLFDHTRYISKFNSYSYNKRKVGDVEFGNYVFGIFPYVYTQPIIKVVVEDLTNYNEEIESLLSYKFVEELCSLKTKQEQEKLLLSYVKKMINDYSINHYIKIPNNISLPSPIKKFSDYLLKFIWKYECPEIFKKLEAPVWIHANDSLINETIYFEYSNENKFKHVGNGTKYPQYVTNICFNKLNKNIIKYWSDELVDLNTYINIENFLWSIKQEPISIPDNKTKIISHGFDIKTSFRKM